MAALLEALSVREPELEAQVAGVGSLAGDVGRMLGLRRDGSRSSTGRRSSTTSASSRCPTRSC